MIEYRAFRNTDPPQLAEIWRSRAGERGLMQPMTMAVLERYVFSRPYFDRKGLIVAAEGLRLLGFAHAGFGPSPDFNTLVTERGSTCVLMLRPDAAQEIAGELLQRAEAYLSAQGACELFGGGCYPLAPFFNGLYGGSEFSGVLDSDPRTPGLLRSLGYREVRRSTVLQRDLTDFRPAIDRQQMQIRRQTTVESIADPPTTTWWEACMFEPFERTRWVLRGREGGAPAASVYLWNMETMAGAWGANAVGIVDLVVTDPRRRQGLAKYLLGESMRNLHSQGVALAEAHVPVENAPAQAAFRSLGFVAVDSAVCYRKV